MGDLQVSPQPNGILTEESSSSVNPQSSNIDLNRWGKAERRTAEIILRIQPTVISEQRRKAVIEYVQRLIQSCVRCEVKLVKCLVENIVVDISFNQLGGLCTLCFLEEVDQLVGKDHLFKRSIILVKAWCYYESRILGAHHGLISTYALETLVLYIFHLFNASLCGPLEVLYRFLDYFSKFDWDNYCVSIQGPVSISSLPEIVAEPPETDRDGLLLSKEFLKTCTDLYSVFPKGQDNQSRSFSPKHLNVIDPLRENNNLGRSVSKGFDLSGDFGTYLSNLEYGKSCQDSGSQGSIMPLPMLSLYVQKQHARKGHAMPIHANMSMLPYVHGYGVAPVRPFLHASGYLGSNPVILPGTFSGDELPKPRSGTGTYIPNPSHRSYKERYSPNRGRSRGAPAQDFTPRVSSQMHRPRSNGRNQATFDSNFQRQTGNKNIDVNSAGVESGDKDRDISRQESLCKSSYQPVSSNTILIPSVGSEAVDIYSLSHMSGHGELSSSTEVNTDGPPVAMRMPHSNALAFPSEQVEFGSFGSVQLGAVSPAVTSEQGRHVDSLVRNGQVSNSGSEAPPAYSSKGILQKPGALSNHQRCGMIKQNFTLQ